MSSLYEKMLSAAMDVQLQASATAGSSAAANVDQTASTGCEQLEDYPAHLFALSNGCRLPFTHPNQQTTMPHQIANDNAGSAGEIEHNTKQPAINAAEMSSNSSSATAITILTPEPTESAPSSSAGGSPRSVCSTLTSEQVPDLVLSEQEAAEKAITCAECANFFDGVTRQPKILDCIHTFCEPCLMRRQIPFSSGMPPHLSITCPLNECGQVTVVTTVAALQTNIPALTMSLVARAIQHLSSPVNCACLLNQPASYLCFSCHQLVCQSCVGSTHKPSQHSVESLEGLNLNSLDAACVSRLVDRLRVSRAMTPSLMTVMCPRHPARPVFSYCETCSMPVCQECTPNHFSTKVDDHVTIHLLKGFDAQTYKHECGFFAAYIKHIRESVTQLRASLDTANRAQAALQQQHVDSNMAVFHQFDQYVTKTNNLHKLYVEQGDEFLSGVALAGGMDKFMTDVEQLREECRRLNELFERARENCSAAEMSSLREWVKRKVFDIRQRCRSINQSVNIKRRHSLPLDMRCVLDNELPKLFDSRLDTKSDAPYGSSASSAAPASNSPYSSAYSRFQQSAQQAASQNYQPSLAPRFSTSTSSRSEQQFQQQQQPPAQNGWPGVANSASAGGNMSNPYYMQRLMSAFANQQQQQNLAPAEQVSSFFMQKLQKRMTGADVTSLHRGQQIYPNGSLTPSSSASTTPTYDLVSQLQQHHEDEAEESQQVACRYPIETGVVTSPLLMSPTSVAIPNRLQLRYIAKIGQFGEADGQFTEPSGIATNHQNQLVVADTNSHRIQVFNNHGAFLWRFGECGKRAGQVLYPNRIAIGPEGEYVFTERAPQCLVQVFDSQGQFIRRFGSGDLRHPRGLCIDPEGHVLVLECQVMSVTIYDMRGTRLRRFTFEGIRFPSSICVNDQQEIFIADNIQHYVYVYSYEGVMKRRIGGYPTINFPVGVAINHLGQLVVADNHNNFNITVFTQDGTPISGYESCVKHAQVLDVCLLNAGRAVAISCKDYRVYVYPYQDCTSSSMLEVGDSGVNVA